MATFHSPQDGKKQWMTCAKEIHNNNNNNNNIIDDDDSDDDDDDDNININN